MELIVGKYYVVDLFSGPISGPFDTRAEAEAERVQLNIAEDCQVRKYLGKIEE